MKIQLKRSNVLNGSDAKEPSANQMEYGELAVNYSDGDPAIFLKDSTDKVIRIAGKGAAGLDGDYVNITGDNMTGNLTLGTDKITLNATNGSITAAGSASIDGNIFAGYNTYPTTGVKLGSDGSITATGVIQCGSNSSSGGAAGVYASNTGFIAAARNGANDAVWRSFTAGSSTEKIYMTAGGSIGAAGGNILLDSSGFVSAERRLTYNGSERDFHVELHTSSPETYIRAYAEGEGTDAFTVGRDGAGTFAGSVTSGGPSIVGGTNKGSFIGYEGNSGFTSGATSSAIRVWTEGTSTPTVDILGNGSASFAGAQTLASASAPASNGYTSHINNTVASTAACFTGNNHNADGIIFMGVDGSSSNAITSKILNDGSATFAQQVTVGTWPKRLDLQPGRINVYTNVSNEPNLLLSKTDSSANAANFIECNNNADSRMFTIAGNGAAEFAGGAFDISSTGLTTVTDTIRVNRTGASQSAFMAQQNGVDNINLQAGGNATFTGTITAGNVNSTSDIALKTDVTSIDGALSRLCNIEGVGFAWKETGARTYGVIAQNVEKEFPELVQTEEFKSVNYNGLVGVLIEAVKELQAEVTKLKSEL